MPYHDKCKDAYNKPENLLCAATDPKPVGKTCILNPKKSKHKTI